MKVHRFGVELSERKKTVQHRRSTKFCQRARRLGKASKIAKASYKITKDTE